MRQFLKWWYCWFIVMCFFTLVVIVLCWGGNSWWNYRLIICIWSYICSRPLQWPLHCLSPALGILSQGYPWIQLCWPTLHTPLLVPSAQHVLRLFFSEFLNLIKSCQTSLGKNKRPTKGLKTSHLPWTITTDTMNNLGMAWTTWQVGYEPWHRCKALKSMTAIQNKIAHCFWSTWGSELGGGVLVHAGWGNFYIKKNGIFIIIMFPS